MKSSLFLSLIILLLQLALLPPLLPSLIPDDASLIEKTCKKTPYHDLCVSTLTSNPNSSDTDIEGLAGMVIDSVLMEATDTLNFTRVLIGQTTDPMKERPLDYCAELYIPVVKYTLPQGRDAFCKGQYKFAEYSLSYSAKQTETCQKIFWGRDVDPLGDRNKVFSELCSIAVAIVNILLKDQ